MGEGGGVGALANPQPTDRPTSENFSWKTKKFIKWARNWSHIMELLCLFFSW